MLNWFKGRRPEPSAAQRLYEAILTQARTPDFYGPGQAPDTVEGRFEVLVLHLALVVLRLRAEEGEDARDLAQQLFDAFTHDMDGALREMGVGDGAVPKRMRKMGEAFYGRALAYEEGLAGDDSVLEAALSRNLYAAVEPSVDALKAMTVYARASAELLAGQTVEDLATDGSPRFAAA